MKFYIDFKKQAQKDLNKLLKDEPSAYKKALKLIAELYDHPRTGAGRPEQLKGEPHGHWSRRITARHRLVYEIHDNEVIVIVLASYGHYDDK